MVPRHSKGAEIVEELAVVQIESANVVEFSPAGCLIRCAFRFGSCRSGDPSPIGEDQIGLTIELVVGRHVALLQERRAFHSEPPLGLSAGGPGTLDSLRIAMRRGGVPAHAIPHQTMAKRNRPQTSGLNPCTSREAEAAFLSGRSACVLVIAGLAS